MRPLRNDATLPTQPKHYTCHTLLLSTHFSLGTLMHTQLPPAMAPMSGQRVR